MFKGKVKGIRILKAYEKLYSNTVLSIFILLSLSIFLLGIKLINENISQLVKYNLNGLLFLSILTCVISTIMIMCLHLFVKTPIERIKNIEKLCKVIMNNQFYIKETFDKKNRMIYFPDFRIYEDNKVIVISIKLDGSKFHRKFLELGDVLEGLYDTELTNKVIENCYCIYTLEKLTADNRLNINDTVEIVEDEIPIMKNLTWYVNQSVHAYISGATRSGKSWFLKYLIRKMLEMKATVKIIDPKNSELSELDEIMGKDNVVTTTGQGIRILKEANKEMERRYEDKAGREKNKAYFIIFDEYVAFYSACNKSEKEETTDYLRQIILKAAEVKIYLILATQRGDTQYLEGSLREQLGTRILLGNSTKEAQKMAFGALEKDLKICTIKGQGSLFMNGLLQVRSFYSPWIPMGYDYKEDIRRILNINKQKKELHPNMDSPKELKELEAI